MTRIKNGNELTTMFHVRSVAPAGLKLYQLRPFQLALYDEDLGTTVAAAVPGKDKKYKFVWKSPNKGLEGALGDTGNVKSPYVSLPITNIEVASVFDKAVTERKPFIGYLGYDGVSACDTLKFECGKSYQLQVHATGKPVRDVHGKSSYTEVIGFTTPCCEGCSAEVATKTVLSEIQNQFYNQSKYVKNFFDLEQVYSCCPAPDPFAKVDFFDYCMSVCDAGDDIALADVQNQYQALKVFRSEYKDGTSTYKVEGVTSQPAAYSKRDTLLSDCGTCPAGYTVVAGYKKYIVRIDNAGTGTTAGNWLTEVQAAGAFSAATAATRISRDGSTSVYEVKVPLNFVEPANPISETSFIYVGSVEPTCLQTTATTFAWAQCGQSYKITRTLCITVKNGDCDNAGVDLAKLQAAYASVPDVVPNSLVAVDAGDCLSTYEIQQYSNRVVDGCDTVGADRAKFAPLPSYNGANWTMCKCEGWTVDNDGCPVPPVATDPAECLGGLKFIGKVFESDLRKDMADIFSGSQNEGVYLEVTLGDPTYFDNCTKPSVTWKVVQTPTLLSGQGIFYAQIEADSRSRQGICYTSPLDTMGKLLQDRRGVSPVTVDLEKFYHHIAVLHRYESKNHAVANFANTRENILLVFDKDKTTLAADLKFLVNSLLSAQGMTKLV